MQRTGHQTHPAMPATVEATEPIQSGVRPRGQHWPDLLQKRLLADFRRDVPAQRRHRLARLRCWLPTRWILVLWAGVLAPLAHAGRVEATSLLHDAPEGSEWIMADWMFLSFLLFAGAAFLAFLAILKMGLLSNLEDAKYHILEIEEEDYYTPNWALEEGGNQ